MYIFHPRKQTKFLLPRAKRKQLKTHQKWIYKICHPDPDEFRGKDITLHSALRMEIIIKTPQQIANIRQSGKYLTELLHKLKNAVKPWLKLIELECIAEDYIQKNHIKGAFKGYNWFPTNLCLSINECVVHGIPDGYTLQKGDLLKIDCGITYQWWVTDAAISIVVGGESANPLAYKLTSTTKDALDIAIQKVGPGKKMYDYSHAVHEHMIQNWFAIIQKLTGHGVWVHVHEKPYIHNHPFHPETKTVTFQPGMVLAFEPITALKSKDFVLKKWNERNLYCKENDLGAHWEYTVLITEDGYEILAGIV